MRNSKKTIISCTIAMSIMFSNTALADTNLFYDGVNHVYTAEPITFMIDDKIINYSTPPIIIEGKTFVPARAAFDEIGADMLWSDETKQMFISYGDKLILLKADDINANVDGTNIAMDLPPKIINDSVMVPLRFFSTALDFEIGWNGNERIAYINSPQQNLTSSTSDSTTESIENADETNAESTSNEVESSSLDEVSTESEPISIENSTLNTENSTLDKIESPPTESSTLDKIENPSTESSTLDEVESSSNESESETTEDIIETEAITVPSNENISNNDVKVINKGDFGVVELINVDMPQNGDETFKILATGNISSISYNLIQDPSRLYIDIENSNSWLDSNISVANSNLVSSIRASQQANLQNVTRIVFDLKSPADYEVYVENQTIIVKFKSASVDKVEFNKTDNEDIIDIFSNSNIWANAMVLSDPNRLVIDIPNTNTNVSNSPIEVDGNFISLITTTNLNGTTRIVLDIKNLLDYQVINNGTQITIKLVKPTYNNIEYKNSNDAPKLILKKQEGLNIDINSITHNDNYSDKIYKLILDNDYSNIYGYGNYKINDNYLNNINIQTVDGKTEITFNEKNIYTCTITEDEQNIYLNVYHPKAVYNHVVVIDAGHGGKDPGAGSNGLVEKNVTLDVSNRLYTLLQNDPDIKPYATRLTDMYPSFDYRTGLANYSADMFVSIHCNSITRSSVSGVQVFYPNPNSERGAKSQQLASYLMEGVTSNTGFPNRPARQSMGYDFYVLRNTQVPACLVEMGFLTSPSDAAKLATEEGRQQVAQGIYEGIKKGFENIEIKRN